MGKKSFMSLLILYAILDQAIASLSEENIESSSDLRIRRKRLIDTACGNGFPEFIERVPYIVNVLKNGFSHCAATIIAPYFVLTSAFCIYERGNYSVFSGSSLRNNGTFHDITTKIINDKFNPNTFDYDISIVGITPHINTTWGPNHEVKFSKFSIPENTVARVSGWGCSSITPTNEKVFPNELRTNTVYTISIKYCQWHFRTNATIEDYHICTFDPSGKRRSCDGDGGNPLVNKKDKLIGIMSYRPNTITEGNPQVYTSVTDPKIKDWIIYVMKHYS